MKSKRILNKVKQKKIQEQNYEKQTGVPISLRIKNLNETGR